MILFNGFAAHRLIVNLNKSVVLDMQIKRELKANSNLLIEAGIALGTRTLEESLVIQPSEANKLVEESINRVSSSNQRIGVLLKYIDNSILKNRIRR